MKTVLVIVIWIVAGVIAWHLNSVFPLVFAVLAMMAINQSKGE